MVTRARNEIVQEHSFEMVLFFIRTIFQEIQIWENELRELEKKNENKDSNQLEYPEHKECECINSAASVGQELKVSYLNMR